MVSVTTEIGRLRRVLMHEPGPEVDRMVPAMMAELLFDDILYGERVREEHRGFQQLLRLLGVEVLEAQELVREALNVDDARQWLLQVLAPDVTEDARRRLLESEPEEMVAAVVGGIRYSSADPGDELYSLPPLVNWCFQRDPQVVLGQGVVFAAMATAARWREGLLARLIFQHHPGCVGAPVLYDPLRPQADEAMLFGLTRPRLEGGDVLVLSPEVIAVGLSERTNTQAVYPLARALNRIETGPRWLLLVQLPKRRAYMHLDTVFTQVDHDCALVHVPVVMPDRNETAACALIDLRDHDLTTREEGDMLSALRKVGLELEPIPCGGDDRVSQLREQWTDGANCVTLAPGVIVLYDRNVRTAEVLDGLGFRVILARDMLLGRVTVDLDRCGRTCILLESHEISRARGGPHCLTHPLVRDEVG